MLTTLRIRNLALVADLTIELQPGYNAITGETGAGKSILIGALNLVLGERADRTLIRSGADACSVEAVFDISSVKKPVGAVLEEHGLDPCQDNELLLKRSLSVAGANRQFINGAPVTLPVLAALGQWLVDIHGPHDHQSLLHPPRQLAILDAFGGLDEQAEAFGQKLAALRELEGKKRELVVDDRTYAQQLDLLRHQVAEITAASLKAGEEEQVAADYSRASNAAQIATLYRGALDMLAESETSIISLAGALGRSLLELKKLDPATAPVVERFDQAFEMLQDLQTELSRQLDKVDLDPERLAVLEERLNLIHSLRRKYGSTASEIIEFGEQATQKLAAMEGRSAELQRLDSEIAATRSALYREGKALTASRAHIIPDFAAKVRKQLGDLGFAQSRLDVELKTDADAAVKDPGYAFTCRGLDRAEFLFAPNPGEPARPLRAIASSGEMARVMLALKTVLASQDQVPVLVFDEVDANVGGQTAQAIGAKMRQIAARRQVLCITHSAHVAAPAATHFMVSKRVADGRTVSEVALLGRKDRVAELARMLGGAREAAVRHAETLLS